MVYSHYPADRERKNGPRDAAHHVHPWPQPILCICTLGGTEENDNRDFPFESFLFEGQGSYSAIRPLAKTRGLACVVIESFSEQTTIVLAVNLNHFSLVISDKMIDS